MNEIMTTSLLLGSLQDAPPLAGEPVAPSTTATTTAAGTVPAGTGPTAPRRPAQDPFGMIWMLIPFLVIMVLVSVMGSRRDKKKRNALMSSIKKHDEVQTTGGIIGSVVELKDDTVVLKIDENSNVRMTFAKSAIVQVISSGSSSEVVQGIKS